MNRHAPRANPGPLSLAPTPRSTVVALLALTGVNLGLAYATSVMAARALDIRHFDVYAVALAAMALLSTLAELGLGKYAMRVIPVFAVRGAHGLARGYGRFGAGTVLVAGVGLALLVGALEQLQPGEGVFGPVDAALCFLPVMALVGYGAELAQAYDATLRSAIVTRVVVPAVPLAGLLAWQARGVELTPLGAVTWHGVGWVVGLGCLGIFMRQVPPRAVLAAAPEVRSREWMRDALPFLGFALLLVAITRSSVIVMELVSDHEQTSVFAAVLETGSILALVAKGTDKMYLPRLSQLLARGEGEQLLRLRRRRLAWVVPLCVAHMGLMLLLGRPLLQLFGEGFEQGQAALAVVSSGTAVWTVFSLKPSYLKYIGRQGFVLKGALAAVLAGMGLTAWLGPRLGALGGAIGFSVPLTCLYLVFALVATRHARRLCDQEREAGAPGSPAAR
ncbi:MAG: hypothetical protein DRQ55_04980 [Planctomycetota bacterium]|nr:MAG: hypothetical protein DRQ55_04980 [Planctomycetota bacterium]